MTTGTTVGPQPCELISQEPDRRAAAPPLLFIHGACHAAWCWENFLPFFARRGYSSHALSLRGHGGSCGHERIRRIRTADYVEDVAEAAGRLPRPPVLIGHSMGGYVVQKYLETHTAPAAVLLASVPVSGALAMLLRIAVRHPWQALRAHAFRSPYLFVETPALARKALFSAGLSDTAVQGHWERLQEESYCVGMEAAVLDPPKPSRMNRVPMLVLGAEHDALFKTREIKFTAAAYAAPAVIIPGMGHDMMLDQGWQNVAERILAWLQQLRS